MGSLCIACGGKIGEFGRRDDFEILKCLRCGLGKTSGVGRGSIERYHRDEIYNISRPQFSNIFKKRVDIIEKFLRGGRVLEIGCSTGLLLSIFKKKGWEVQGVEPSGIAYQLATKEGIPTKNTSFEKAKLKGNFYDLVVLNHVLEHMRDPRKVLEKVRRVLKKDGIVFIDVPNFGGLSARIWGIGWKYILPKEHKWHFTNEALQRLIKKAGLKVIYRETRSGIWDCSNPWLEVYQSLVGGKKRFFINFMTAIPSYFIGRVGFGSGLTVIAAKK